MDSFNLLFNFSFFRQLLFFLQYIALNIKLFEFQSKEIVRKLWLLFNWNVNLLLNFQQSSEDFHTRLNNHSRKIRTTQSHVMIVFNIIQRPRTDPFAFDFYYCFVLCNVSYCVNMNILHDDDGDSDYCTMYLFRVTFHVHVSLIFIYL